MKRMSKTKNERKQTGFKIRYIVRNPLGIRLSKETRSQLKALGVLAYQSRAGHPPCVGLVVDSGDLL